MTPLHVSSFGAGVSLQGAVGQRKIDELVEADGYEIGTRGALVAASDCAPYIVLEDGNGAPWTMVHALLPAMPGFNPVLVLAIGEGGTASPGTFYLMQPFARVGEPSPLATAAPVGANVVATEGIVVTGYPWPGVWTVPNGMTTKLVNVSFFCLGAREGFAPRSNANFGLYVAMQDVGGASPTAFPIKDFNALGTGVDGDGTFYDGIHLDVGNSAQQLFFRGVIAYNNHAFGYGFDSADATNGDGPARVMFSNLGLPLKYGNDNVGTPGNNRIFTDSDAIVLGGAGEIIRGAITIFGKLFFGTNKGLHFIAGYGRDSFLSDGFTPVMKAFNIVGPYAMIEGPDKLLYGVSDQGLWNFDDADLPNPLYQKLVDFDGQSNGYWDLIWTDETQNPDVYPGTTNQDLVWTAVDWDRHQVLVGIPWCNAAAGAGYGLDTVVIKYHVLTGGFTRQVFPGVQYTAAGYARREGQQRETRFMGTATPGQTTVQRYGDDTGGVSPILPAVLPVATVGPYAAQGPDGRGIVKRVYLTLAWESMSSLPLQFQVSTTVDQAQADSFLITIGAAAPVTPATNDLWLDTSLTDPNLGNGTSGTLVPRFPAAILKRWSGSTWQQIPGVASNGLRAILRLALAPRAGTWMTTTIACVTAGGRYQLEAFAEDAGGGKAAA